MILSRSRWLLALASFVLAFALSAPVLQAQDEPLILGSVTFPTSGSPEAQEDFEVGVLALHSFWYEEARDRFKRAQERDPGFAMAYWGEAMTHDHPLWSSTGEQDSTAARAVLSRLDELDARGHVNWTSRERGYVDAVRHLCAEGSDLQTRREAYATAMNDLTERYPDDDEAAIFAALARMSVPAFDWREASNVVSVAAPLEAIYQRHPEHPGVLHYLIHAYDSPTFAPMGLRQARVYARVAPASSHALHMPSHIFRALGMWEEMAASNKDAYEASVRWQERTERPLSKRDFHALDWLQTAYLELGRYADARRLVDAVKEMEAEAERSGQDPEHIPMVRATLEAKVQEFESWTGLGRDLGPVDEAIDVRDLPPDESVMALGYRAAVAGQDSLLATIKEHIRSSAELPPLAEIRPFLEASVHDLEAERLRARGDIAGALVEARRAMEILKDAAIPDSELLKKRGDFAAFLLRLGQAKEAHDLYVSLTALSPREARYRLGQARAAAALGATEEATRQYRRFLDLWRKADAGLPVLEEAREHIHSQEGGNEEP